MELTNNAKGDYTKETIPLKILSTKLLKKFVNFVHLLEVVKSKNKIEVLINTMPIINTTNNKCNHWLYCIALVFFQGNFSIIVNLQNKKKHINQSKVLICIQNLKIFQCD